MEKERKQEIIKQFARHEKDVGSPEVQVAILTERIRELTEHFKKHPKDNNSKRGFFIMIGRRKKLLNYLKRKDYNRYRELIARLGLRK
ncbi:MAG TPA: 30S ribosomal protein S15 [candidate division Zixibacteria bacterium]|nr:30S ribosomal protein S15 [candidate division Zixibacteria bacterium]